MSKIELTIKQRELLGRDLRGEFNQYTATEMERGIYSGVIEIAEKELHKGGDAAIDAMIEKYNGSMMEWFNKEKVK